MPSSRRSWPPHEERPATVSGKGERLASMENEKETKMAYGSDYKYIPATSIESGQGFEVAFDVFGYTVQIVNLVYVGQPGQKDYVLVDAGIG